MDSRASLGLRVEETMEVQAATRCVNVFMDLFTDQGEFRELDYLMVG